MRDDVADKELTAHAGQLHVKEGDAKPLHLDASVVSNE
jgi:hypothetical protein